MMGRILRVTALTLLLATSAQAQQKAPPTGDPQAIAAAKELMIAMGSLRQFEVAIDTMTRGLADLYKKQAPAKGREIDEVMGLMASKFNARKMDMLDMVAPLYAEKFTIAELRDIGAFYKTPIGQKMINTQPEIMQRSMQLGMAWGQMIGRDVELEALQELKKRGVEL
jgi:uncharacterized protein